MSAVNAKTPRTCLRAYLARAPRRSRSHHGRPADRSAGTISMDCPTNRVSAPWQPGHLHWIPVGKDRGNGGRIKLAGEPMNPLAERLVNGMESLIEHARLRELKGNPAAVMPNNPRDAVLRYFGFPKLDSIERLDDERAQGKARAGR